MSGGRVDDHRPHPGRPLKHGFLPWSDQCGLIKLACQLRHAVFTGTAASIWKKMQETFVEPKLKEE
jgi:hypothetical protein